MHLAIFGASGKTGQHLVGQALAQGHIVTALVRNPAKLTIQHPNLKLVQGDVSDTQAVAQAMTGAEAVVSVLGPSENKPIFAISRGMDVILSTMQRLNIRRLVISAGAGVRDPQDKIGLFDRFIGLLLHLVSRYVVEDMKQVVAKVRQSDRDWVIVRVPMLTDDPAKGDLKIGYLGQGTGIRLSRADMASFMLRQIQSNTYVKQAPVISN